MSRAYRIKVSESLHRIIKADDRVSTHLELLDVLPQDEMAAILSAELRQRGFEQQGQNLMREQNGIAIAIDPAEGLVSVTVSESVKVDLHGEEIGWAAEEDGKHAQRTEEALKKRLHKRLESEAGAKQQELQSKLTDHLETELAELRQELNEIANRVTASALKRKASQMGQIKELSEDPQSGSMTIVLEVE